MTEAGPTGGVFSGERYDPNAGKVPAGAGIQWNTPSARPVVRASSSSTGVVSFTPATNIAWLIKRMTISTGVDFSTCSVYVAQDAKSQSFIPENLASKSDTAKLDENDPNQPYFVPEGQTISFVFYDPSGVLLTTRAVVRLEYQEV